MADYSRNARDRQVHLGEIDDSIYDRTGDSGVVKPTVAPTPTNSDAQVTETPDPVESGMRVFRITVTPDMGEDLHDGIVVGQLVEGESVFNFQLGVSTAFNGTSPRLKLGVPGNALCISGGEFDLNAVDQPAGGGLSGTDLLTPTSITFPAMSSVAPEDGIDITLTLDNGGLGTPSGATTGVATIVLVILAGYNAPS